MRQVSSHSIFMLSESKDKLKIDVANHVAQLKSCHIQEALFTTESKDDIKMVRVFRLFFCGLGKGLRV